MLAAVIDLKFEDAGLHSDGGFFIALNLEIVRSMHGDLKRGVIHANSSGVRDVIN